MALLSVTQGLHEAIATQLQRGFATDVLIISAGGGIGGVESGFTLLVNDTETIKQIENVTATIAVIQRAGYIKNADGKTRRVTIVGIDFDLYKSFYEGTFIAECGEIPINPENISVVVGKRISDPWGNGTLFCTKDDDVEIIWTNTTARPLRNESYIGNIVAVLREIGGFSIGGPSDTSVYIPNAASPNLLWDK